jgi:hypothetical protein
MSNRKYNLKYLIKELAGKSPEELANEKFDKIDTDISTAFNLMGLYLLDDLDDPIPKNKIKLGKLLGEGSYNSAYLSTVGKGKEAMSFVYRIAYDTVNAKERKLRLAETTFNKIANEEFPGMLTEFTFYSNNYSKHPFEIKEAFDGDLEHYLKKVKDSSKQVDAVQKAFECMEMMDSIGINCLDQTGGNFLYMKGRKPIGCDLPFDKNTVFVRMTDLGADFCTKNYNFGKYTLELLQYRNQLQLILNIKSYLTKKALTTILVNNGMCDSDDVATMAKWIKYSANRKNAKNVSADWKESWKVFIWYAVDERFLPKNSQEYGTAAEAEHAGNKFVEFIKKHCGKKKSPPKKKKKSPAKKKKKSLCDGKKCPSDKICNPSSGRCVYKNGKIGKVLMANKKSPPEKKKSPPKSPPKKKKSLCDGKKCPSAKICNPSSGRCVYKNGKIGKVLMANKKSPPPKKKKKKKKKKGRKAPDDSATKFNVGTRKRGNDGNMWEVVTNKNGAKRWKKDAQ